MAKTVHSPVTKTQLYGAFNEISELVEEAGSFFPLLEELQINQDDAIAFASKSATQVSRIIKEYANDRIRFSDNMGVGVDITKFLGTDSHTNIEYMLMMWINGLLSYLIIKEREGYTWPHINMEVLEKTRKELNRDILPTVLTPDFRKMGKYRAVYIMAKMQGKRVPLSAENVFLSNNDKRLVGMGEAMFADGFLTASAVHFTKREM